MAVGSSTGGLALAERWHGKRWAIQPSPSEGDEGYPFAGVSCGSARACTAVGLANYDLSTGAESALVEHWDGTEWAGQSGPSDAGTFLSGVSCASRRACIAVGTGPDTASMAWRWNGKKWASQPISGTEPLAGISCSSARRCTAVGFEADASGNTLTLAERWNGRRWAIKRTLSPGPA